MIPGAYIPILFGGWRGGVNDNGDDSSAKGTRNLGGAGDMPSGKILKFGSRKWHFQHSESMLSVRRKVLKHLSA